MQEAAIWNALKDVLDPEYPISVVDMGMIRGVSIEDDLVTVRLTFTSSGCPCQDWIKEDIEKKLKQELGIDKVKLETVWDHPWTSNDMTDEAKQIMENLFITTRK